MDRTYTNFNHKLNRLKKHAHAPVMPVSAQEGDNLEILLESLKEVVDKERDKLDEDDEFEKIIR